MSTAENNFIGKYWEPAEGSKILCYLCPRRCIISDGKRGFCFVRQNVNGKLVLSTYGRSSGFCIDPIEKKPLNHFFPGSGVLSFGTAGCNLGCKFCQNWDMSKCKSSDRLSEEATPDMIAQAAKKFGCKSVAFTYNDPVVFVEYAMDVADECHKVGIKTVAVTAGYISDKPRKDFFEHIDAANVDLKAFTEDFYKRLVLGKLKPVLDTLIYIKHKTNVWLEITNLIIPGENDSYSELDKMCDWIAKELGLDVPIHFSAFHPDFKMTDCNATSGSALLRARDIAFSKGIRYVYVGNVSDKNASSTYCHNCKKLIIERNWYDLGEYHIKGGKCEYCNTECSGRFENKIGDWGSKRQPVKMR